MSSLMVRVHSVRRIRTLWCPVVATTSLTSGAGWPYLYMRIDQTLKMVWLAGSVLVASSGCTTEDAVREPVVAMIAITDSNTDHADTLRGLSVDPATYDALVGELGGEPHGIELHADAPTGTVELILSPTSPLVAAYLAEPAAGPPLSIAFDDGSSEPVGLLLPAVQKVREAAMHGDGTPTQPAGTLSITLEGEVAIGLLLPAVQKVREAAGRPDERPASIAVLGTHVPGVDPAQRAQMADAFIGPTGIARARLVGGDVDLVVGSLDIPDPALMERWSSAATPMNLVVDVRMDGPVITRVRVPRAQPSSTGPAATAQFVVLGGLASWTRNGDAERAMFDAGYPTFTSDALDKLGRLLLDYSGSTTMSLGISRWTEGRTQALADILTGAGAGGTGGFEAMACVAALPTALAVARALDLGQPERASAAATVEEALIATTPLVGLVVGGELAMQAYGAPAPVGDAELACAAVRQLASLPDTAANADGQALRALALDLDAFDARRLEIELAAWIAAMDAIVAAPDEGDWAAARAKADILLEALADASAHTLQRWQLAATMIGR